MSSLNSVAAGTDASPSTPTMRIVSRPGSRASASELSQVDKAQLSQVLDKIHTSASQSDTLTTFNEFSSPPSDSTGVETKGLADELIQNGISGLYNRFKDVVVGGKEKANTGSVKDDVDGGESSSLRSQPQSNTPSNKGAMHAISRGNISSLASPTMLSTSASRIQSPTDSSFAIQSPPGPESSQQQGPTNTSASKLVPANRPQVTPLTKSTPSANIVPTVAPAIVTAFRQNDTAQRGHGTSQNESPIADNSSLAKKSPFSSLAESPRDRRYSNRSDMSEKSLTPTLSNFQERSHVDARVTSRSSADQSVKHSEQDVSARQSTFLHSKSTPKDSKDRPDLRVDLPRVSDTLKNLDGIDDARVSSHTSLSGHQPASNSPLQVTGISGQPTSIQFQTAPALKRSAAIDRLTQSRLAGYRPSRASSTDLSTAEFSPITTSAHNSVRHESFSQDDDNATFSRYSRIPGTTTSGDPKAVTSRLEQMRKQVLSKEYWMKDETCKECFLCGSGFTAFRRKHHCRTCGCIFDSKCTSIVQGDRFGVQGSLRVCKTCLDFMNRRDESSDSEDSVDDAPNAGSFFSSHFPKFAGDANRPEEEMAQKQSDDGKEDGKWYDKRQIATPMMAIPAMRRTADSSSRRSAILEIDAPQLPRPQSSKSLKSLSGRPSSGHRRMHSKHNFAGRFKSTAPEQRALFRRDAVAEMGIRSRLPAFHDDNIIDPDLAAYMSDDESSGDEQISIYAAMNGVGSGIPTSSFDNERSGLGALLTTGKRHRARPEKSVSGISFTSRGGIDDGSVSGSAVGHSRTGRRRNLSAASNIIHHNRASPRSNKMGGLMKGIGNLGEELLASREFAPSTPAAGSSKMTRALSMRDEKYPPVELHPAMLGHVEALLRQLLQREKIPKARSWEKALLPILLRCIDDVNMNVRRGDEIDIRHYVKLKKIPGGRPGDTSYVSGVVFTKNVALKSMPRSISNPRIMVVSGPIEYSRARDTFMSLGPIIAQEKEFLQKQVNRIADQHPTILLVQKHVSGLALKYLAEAKITVIANVKTSVIEAVSRCTETTVLNSIDQLPYNFGHLGKSSSFDVRTHVHKDIPGKKKTLIYISGCEKELGCTIVLRGASMPILSKMKRITEFMVYVVYNDMLETSLMRDQFVSMPSFTDESGSLSPSNEKVPPSPGLPQMSAENASAQPDVNQESEAPAELRTPSNMAVENADQSASDAPKLVSAHESHVTHAHENQVPEDVPMPTFYSDLVAKHETKILSASPFVKFMQPYLLVRVREQERLLMHLKRLRDQDTFEEQTEDEKAKPQRFQLITPQMVNETVKGAPKQIMEVLHAVHDAEYDKALHNYQTHKRQWENSIQGNVDLFDPYWHQNIVVLYTLVCTATTVPCSGPEVLALEFYNEHLNGAAFDADCTLGQYIEDLCLTSESLCSFESCRRKMTEHHRTYVHGEARITIFLEKMPSRLKGLENSVLMWSRCRICNKEMQVMPMSESTWKYSFGKFLELAFWSSGLHMRAGACPHDFFRDHVRYFGFNNIALRIHYDKIDLLEIVVPRARITWKVDNDLKLKNDFYTRTEERWNRFMASVKSRIKGININSVVQEKSEACNTEIEKMMKRANEEHESMILKLQEKYMESKYYEIIPMNRAVRAMQEIVVGWDHTFENFDKNFFPSERDIRRLATIQLQKVFMNRDDSTTSLVSTDPGDVQSDLDERSTTASIEMHPHLSGMSPEDVESALNSVLDEDATVREKDGSLAASPSQYGDHVAIDLEQEAIQPLDLASQPTTLLPSSQPCELLEQGEIARSPSPSDPGKDVSPAEMEKFPSVSEASDSTIRPNKSTTADVAGPKEALVTNPPVQVTGIPRPADRKTSRRVGTIVSPSVSRTQSQPVKIGRRIHTPTDVTPKTEASDSGLPIDHSMPPSDMQGTVPDIPKGGDRKLTERFGLNMKTQRKVGQSLIPRSIQNRRQDSKVSALAKHFDQLSREFEKERMRDRKQRAATVTQSRAFPKASSKPIVEVYKNVSDAVEERGPSDDDIRLPPAKTDQTAFTPSGEEPNSTQQSADITRSASPSGTIVTNETSNETDALQTEANEAHSDEEGTASDVETSLLEDVPGAADIAIALDDNEPIAGAEVNLELPKHERKSMMTMLSNFWAERSASGWTPLEYPMSGSDHIFNDSDVFIREDEPSSLIAFSLGSADYKEKLRSIRHQKPDVSSREYIPQHEKSVEPDPCQDGVNQAEIETSLLRATGTHLKYHFTDGPAKLTCKIFYAEQFDAVRRKCGVSDRIVESLSRCAKWDSKGGKSKSVFLKTLDERLVLKSLSPIETQAFLVFAPAYFNLMAEALFHDLPTVIAKMLGFYQIVIKNPITNTEVKLDFLIMENLFYDRNPSRTFDLKGSMRNRKIQSTGEQNEVLLDENMVELIYESPLFAREHSKKLLRASVWNDTLFLARQNVMDYSLMMAVDEERKELVVGIIDCIRTFTWDKKLESWIKEKGFVGGNKAKPTVTSPKEYKYRFREAMARYLLQAPSCWHQFKHEPLVFQQNRKPQSRVREGDVGDEGLNGDRDDNA